MENQNNQNTNPTFNSGAPPQGATNSVVPGGSPATAPQPLSLDPALDQTPLGQPVVAEHAVPQPKMSFIGRLVRRADIILALLLVLGALGLFWGLSRDSDQTQTTSGSVGQQYGTMSIPLQGIISGGEIDFSDQNVIINGKLTVNSDFVLDPSDRPIDPTAGQLYYDQTSNVLAYFDGEQFIEMVEGVVSLQGLSGAVTFTGVGGITISDDGAGNITFTGSGGDTTIIEETTVVTGVTSLNDATGALTINNTATSGSTITIDDASTSTKGIASFNSTNFTASSGAINTVQNISTTSTPTFAGVNVATVQGTSGLSLLSNNNITIGTTDSTGTLLVVDTKTTSGDPTGIDGAIYYNSADNNFRCHQNGAWVDCVTASGGFVSLQNAYDNSTPATIDLDATNGGIMIRDNSTPIGGNLFAVQDTTGATDYLAVTAAGVDIAGTLAVSGAATLQSTLAVQGSAITIGTTTQQGALNLHAGNTNVATLQAIGTLGQDTTYILPDPSAASATICLSTGNCAGAGTGVTTSGGTTGTIPIFTSSQNIEDSIITQSGSTTITINGDLAVVTGGLTLSNALTVSNGGTGATSLAANGVIVGNGTAALSSVVAGSSGLCLVSTAGTPSWSACPGSGGVSSLNSQTGAVSIANASGSGGIITIDDASTSAKGIASFNSTNFSVTGGAVNTIQNIDTSAAPTFAGLTVQGASITVGTTSQSGSLILNDGSLNTGTLLTTSLGSDRTYTLPDATGTICISTGNCAGQGGSVGGSGTNNFVAKFTSTGSTIGDSSISDDGSVVTINGNVNFSVQGSSVTVGLGASRTGSLVLQNSTNTNTVALQSGVTSASYVLTLPTAVGSVNQCLKEQSGTGTLFWDDCLGGGGTSGITSINSQTGPSITIANASAASNTITIDDASTAAKGIAQFNSTNFTVVSGVVNTVQNINTTATPQFAGLTTTGNINVTSGGVYQINGSQISSSALSNDSNLAKLSSSQTFTGNTNAFQNTVDSTNAFNVQNAAGTAVATVDTQNGQLILGTGSLLDGALVFSNVSNANTVTIAPGTPTADRTLTLPDASGIICTDSGNCAGAGATLQTAYNFSAGGTTPKIKVNSTLLGVDIQDADTTIGANLFNIRASNSLGLGSVMFGVGNTGQVILQNSANSTTALRVLTQGGTGVLTVDTTNGRTTLGQAGTLAGSLLLSDAGSAFAGTLTQGSLTSGQTYTLPDETGTICLQNSTNCGFAASSGSSSYIQNQSASPQTADFNISGTGVAGAFHSTTFDTATNTNLFIGNANATSISIGNTGANILTTIYGSASVRAAASNSTTTFQVQNTSSASLFSVDTTNNRVVIGEAVADSTGTTLVLDSKNTTGDPTGTDGATYYNSNDGKFRCYEGGTWKDCIGSSSTTTAPEALTGTGNVTTNESGTTDTNMTCTTPANIANGQLLLAYVFNRGPSGTLTAPAGWSEFTPNSTSPYEISVFYKPITNASAEPASYTFTSSVAGRWICGMGLVVGADLSNPQDSSGTVVSGGTTSLVLPQVTTLTDNTLLIGFGTAGRADATPSTFSTPTGMTELFEESVVASPSGTAASTTAAWAEPVYTAGATGTRTSTISPTAVNSSGFMFAIRAAQPGSSFATLQSAYDNSASDLAEIKLDSTRGAVDIQDADTTIGANLLNVRASNSLGFGDVLFGVGNTGAITLQNSVDSTAALQVQNAAGTATVLVADTTNTRVGIGADTPEETLDVTGNLQVKDATDTKSYRLRTSGSSLDFEASGAALFLSVWSGASYTGTQRNYLVLEEGSTTAQALGSWQFRTGAFGTARHTIDGTTGANVAFNQNGEATDFSIQGDTDAELFYVDGSADRVGISTNTPGFTLDVGGTLGANGAVTFQNAVDSTAALRVLSSTGGSLLSADTVSGIVYIGETTGGNHADSRLLIGDFGGGIGNISIEEFGTTDTDVLELHGKSGIELTVTDASDVSVLSLSATGAATFQNDTDSGAGFRVLNAAGTSTPLAVDTTGLSVDIGSTTVLTLDGGTGDQLIKNATGTLQIGNYGTGGTVQVQADSFEFQNTTDFTANLEINSTGQATFMNSANSTTAFRVLNAAGTTSVLTVDTTNGFVGVGAAPSNNFDVEGADAAGVIGEFRNTANDANADGILIDIGYTGTLGAGNNFIGFYGNGSLIGQIEGNGAGGTAYQTTSDRRLKEDIHDTQYTLDDLLKIQVTDYNFISSGVQTTGFIAQDLFEIYPHAVSVGSDDLSDPWGIDYGALTPLIVKGVQDLAHTVDGQQVLLGNTNGTVSSLNRKVNRLNNTLGATTNKYQSSLRNIQSQVNRLSTSVDRLGDMVTNSDLQNGTTDVNINDLKVTGNIEVTGNATFRGQVSVQDITINGHLTVGGDTAGTVTIPAGQTSAAVTFERHYNKAPKITTGVSDFVQVIIVDKSVDGFTVRISEPLEDDLYIDWAAFEPKAD